MPELEQTSLIIFQAKCHVQIISGCLVRSINNLFARSEISFLKHKQHFHNSLKIGTLIVYERAVCWSTVESKTAHNDSDCEFQTPLDSLN